MSGLFGCLFFIYVKKSAWLRLTCEQRVVVSGSVISAGASQMILLID